MQARRSLGHYLHGSSRLQGKLCKCARLCGCRTAALTGEGDGCLGQTVTFFEPCFISNGSSGPEETTGSATAVLFSAVWSTLRHTKKLVSLYLPTSHSHFWILFKHT